MTQVLASDQAEAFKAIEGSDLPWFVTGPAGTGKSRLLEHLRDRGRDKDHTAVLAFTGSAAVNVDGVTIHSFALQSKYVANQISAYVPLPGSRELRKKNYPLLAATRLLIIDEVSMARADMLDALDRAMREAKNEPHLPFGGARLVMFGDLYQLPPVLVDHELFRRERKFLKGYEDPECPYFFQAHVFTLLKIQTFNLYIPKRQDEEAFIKPLNEFRTGNASPQTLKYFNDVADRSHLDEAVHLFANRQPARDYNEAKLARLSGAENIYKAELRTFAGSELLPNLANEDNQPAPAFLRLKTAARVMLVKNLDLKRRLVNGSVGTVVEMQDDHIFVEFEGLNQIVRIDPVDFDLKGYVLDSMGDDQVDLGDVPAAPKKIKSQVIGTYTQLPIILCWGMTIHKAQGKTIEHAAIDFRNEYKTAGQAYVALSRVRTVSGLSMLGRIGFEHLKPYSLELRKFALKPDLKSEVAHSQAAKKKINAHWDSVQKSMPWREPGWVQSVVDKHLLGIPQIIDGFGFDHKRRILYLETQFGLTPSSYIEKIVEIDPSNALILSRNIDRSTRNKPLVYSSEIMANKFELGIRDRLEMTTSQALASRNEFGASWTDVSLSHVGRGEDLNLPVLSMPNPEMLTWSSSSGLRRFVLRREGFYFHAYKVPVGLEIGGKIDRTFRLGAWQDSMLELIHAERRHWENDSPPDILVRSSMFDQGLVEEWLGYLFLKAGDVRVLHEFTSNEVEL